MLVERPCVWHWVKVHLGAQKTEGLWEFDQEMQKDDQQDSWKLQEGVPGKLEEG